MTPYLIKQRAALVEYAAKARGDVPVDRRFIIAALQSGGAVEAYPTGAPSLQGIYDLALTLSTIEKAEQEA